MILILKINQKLKRFQNLETMSLYWKKWIFLGKKKIFLFIMIFIMTYTILDIIILFIKFIKKFFNLN